MDAGATLVRAASPSTAAPSIRDVILHFVLAFATPRDGLNSELRQNDRLIGITYQTRSDMSTYRPSNPADPVR
jgi:hypothetical protein